MRLFLFVLCASASTSDPDFHRRTWLKANPSLPYMPPCSNELATMPTRPRRCLGYVGRIAPLIKRRSQGKRRNFSPAPSPLSNGQALDVSGCLSR